MTVEQINKLVSKSERDTPAPDDEPICDWQTTRRNVAFATTTLSVATAEFVGPDAQSTDDDNGHERATALFNERAGEEDEGASLQTAIAAQIGGETIPIGTLELQIADKLSLGAQKDIENAVHLYLLFEESLSEPRLKEWVTRLEVESEYERLTRA